MVISPGILHRVICFGRMILLVFLIFLIFLIFIIFLIFLIFVFIFIVNFIPPRELLKVLGVCFTLDFAYCVPAGLCLLGSQAKEW